MRNQINELKSEGNTFFKKGEYESAITRFSDAISIAIAPDKATSAVIAKFSKEERSMIAILLANRAMCFLKLKPPENYKALRDCRLAIQADPRL